MTLLPRHWDWLNVQPGGASVALRKLVDEARRVSGDRDRIRAAQEAAYRFMSAIAGNLPGFEEATRSLFAYDRRRFTEFVAKCTEAAVELLGLRVGLVRDGAVGGDHQRRDVLVDTTAEHIDAGILRLAYDRVCRFADGSHVFVGDVHRRSGEGIPYK